MSVVLLTRFGVLFAVLGFGSLVLEQLDMEFRLIAWASDMQPFFGFVLGLVGLLMIGGDYLLRQRKAARATSALSPAPGSVQPGAGQPGAMQPGAMQPGFAQPRPVQPGATQAGLVRSGPVQPGTANQWPTAGPQQH